VKTKGFTLIELLIVVAIIAILAAIAVPNFLEAQVRAKVSRVHSDLRSLATAIESYATDYGRGPIGSDEALRLNVPGVDGSNKRLYALHFLTTPIQYVTSIPDDPFAIHGRKNQYGQFFTTKDYVIYEYQYNDELGTGYAASRARGYDWWIWSSGPYMFPTNYWPPQITALIQPPYVYDPTNGTVSAGYIVRTNKGVMTGGNI